MCVCVCVCTVYMYCTVCIYVLYDVWCINVCCLDFSETAGLNFAGNYSSNNSIKVVTGMSSTLSCFSAEVGSIQTFTLYKNHDKGPPTPINTSRYNHTNGCLRMGPLHASDSGTYTVILEDCLSAHTSFSLQLEVEGK